MIRCAIMTILDDPSLNPKILAEIRALRSDASPHFLAEIIDLFLKDTPPRLARLQQALQQRDAAALKMDAHTLKGGSGNLGVCRMSRLCLRLEEAIGRGDWPGTADYVSQIEDEFARAGELLKAERDR